jgi:hypothetical protein
MAAMLANPQNTGQLELSKQIQRQFGSVQAYLDMVCPVEWNAALLSDIFRSGWPSQEFLLTLLLPLMWPWLVVASLLVFRVSMRLARVKPMHVLRCVVYSVDLLVWVGGAMFATTVIVLAAERGSPQPAMAIMPGLLGCIFVLGVGIAAYRMGTAYRCYLRFDHPFATVFASHIIASLLMCKLTLVYLSWSIW